MCHGGTLTGFRAGYPRLLDDKVSVIVLSNGAAAMPAVIANEVAKHYVQESKLEPAGAAD